MVPSTNASQAHDPVVGVHSDGATDGYTLGTPSSMIPKYNIDENANTVPKYTREYLQKLSTAVHARLKMIDGEIAYYEESLAKTRRIHKCLMSVLVVLGILWLVTSIIILVAMFEENGIGKFGKCCDKKPT
ncbi:hypothetical protein GQX73_g2868 [Xylaria multiplex]|uniref:Uncharacterized protein n=1 Tax=Xylaria multiplex TaxID=323545 RepID=A0A7C8N1A5_9PEZI|nr:hypothetical protein GQX73_g2868 [Xylaria multiplex]